MNGGAKSAVLLAILVMVCLSSSPLVEAVGFLRFQTTVSPGQAYYRLTTTYTVTIYNVQYDVIGSSMIRIEPTSAGTWGYPTLVSITGVSGWDVYRTERGILKIHSHGDDLQIGESMTVTFTMKAPDGTQHDETQMFVDGYSDREAGMGDNPGSHYFRMNDLDVYVPPHLIVNTNPAIVGSTTGSGWYLPGTVVSISAPEYKEVAGQSRHRFTGWTSTGGGTIADASAASTTYQVYGNPVVTAQYDSDYLVTFSVSGLDPDAGDNAVLTLEGTEYGQNDLPNGIWVNDDATFTWANPVAVSSTERFPLTGQTGTSPFRAAGTYSATYKKQWKASFTQTGIDADAGPATVLTLGGTSYRYDTLPSDAWVDHGTAFSWADPVEGVSANVKFVKTEGADGAVTSASTISSSYQERWRVTFTAAGLGAGAAENTVLTLDGTAYRWDDLPIGVWVDVGVPFAWADTVPVSPTERYNLSGQTGTSPIADDEYSAAYQTQWMVTFTQTGIDADAVSAPILSVGGTNYDCDALPSGIWVDAGTTYAWTDTLTVDSGERYIKVGQTGTPPVTSAGTHSAVYQRQWRVAAGFSTSDGSTPIPGVVLSGIQAGSAYATTLTASAQNVWLDDGSAWSVSESIPASPTDERWLAVSGTTGTAAPALTIAPEYIHQYRMTLSYSVLGGDSYDPPTFTADRSGQPVDNALSATAQDFWFDSGSHWSVTNPITGSDAGERGYTSQQVSGTVSAAATTQFTYHSQYMLTIQANGLPSSSPTNIYLGGGAADGGTAYDGHPFTKWFDAGAYTGTIGVDPSFTEYAFTGWDDATTTNPHATMLMSGARTLAANYAPLYTVTFTESGLPPGTSWRVIFNGQARSSTSDTITFPGVATRTGYSYKAESISVQTGERYYPDLYSGSLDVSGDTAMSVTYYHQYLLKARSYNDDLGYLEDSVPGNLAVAFRVDCTYLGVPRANMEGWTGVKWIPAVHFSLPWALWADAGTSVTIHDVQNYFPGASGVSGVRYRYDEGLADPIAIDGSSTLTLNYITQYRLTLETTGLPSTNPADVYLGGDPTSEGTVCEGQPLTLWFDKDTYTGTIGLESSVGAYVFSGWDDAASNPHPTLLMSTPLSVTANYIFGYTVTFAEEGLPSGTSWSVTFNGVTKSSADDAISFVGVPPGAGYSYIIDAVSVSGGERYAPASGFGTLDVYGDASQSTAFYHQFLFTPYYTVSDGSSPAVADSVNYIQFGNTLQATPTMGNLGGAALWADAGSDVTYASPIGGSAGERWQVAPSDGGTHAAVSLSAPTDVSVKYFHQHEVTFHYSVDGPTSSTSHSDPAAEYTQFGEAQPPATASGQEYWVDAGTPVRYSNPLGGSNPTERWVITVGGVTYTSPGYITVETVTCSSVVNPTYHHQFKVAITYTGDMVVGSGVTTITLRGTLQVLGSPTSTEPVAIGFVVVDEDAAVVAAYPGNAVSWGGNTIGTTTKGGVPNPGVNTYTVYTSLEDNDHYYGDGAAATLIVYQPTGSFVTGGGWVLETDASRGNFGFVANYNKNQKPKGSFVYTWRSGDGFDYVIKSNSWTGLALQDNRAMFQGRANVRKVDPSTGETVWVVGNYQFTVEVYDNTGKSVSGGGDALHLRVLSPDGTVFHEVGTAKEPLSLSGGQIIVHAK